MTRGAKPSPDQLPIDFNRCTRRTWIEKLILPPFDRIDSKGRTVKVRTARSKLLLRVLESKARDGGACFLKLETIAREMGSENEDTRTASRAIADCVDQGLVVVTPSYDPRSASKYEIQWTRVKEFILAHPDTEGLINVMKPAEDRAKATREATAKPAENSELTHDKLSGTHDMLSVTHDKLSDTHDMLSPETGGDTSYRVRAVLNHEFNHERKPSIKPCSSSAVDTVDSIERSTGGWGRMLTIDDFQNRDTLEGLWLKALTFRYVSPDMRLRFFTLAKYSQRMFRAHKVRDIGAYFTSQLQTRNWLGDPEDIRAALNAITILDGRR